MTTDEDPHALQSTEDSQRDATSEFGHMMRKSCKWTNLRNNKSQIPFVSDTISLQHYILLHSVKYIYLITFTILSVPSHHFVYGGVLEINGLLMFVYLLI